jgi:hypothetical protein
MTIQRFVMGSPDTVGVKYDTGVRVLKGKVVSEKTIYLSTVARDRPNAWEKLHTYNGDDPETFLRTVFEPLIPSYGCSCKSEYLKYKKDNPPDFSSPEAFFLWGVDLHNWVNFKLIEAGDTIKRIVTIEEARNLWRRG